MPFYDVDINETIQEDFLEYAGHVMQERSIPDARDGLKDGARKILYSQFQNKNTYKEKFIKGQVATSEALKTAYTHGDAAAYSTLVRMGKPFAVRYPFETIQGNGGNQSDPDNHAAGRYLEIKLSELGTSIFNGIKKNAINDWYWTYNDTTQFPRVLPCYGFYPLIQGISGISVGLNTSIPSFNLKEVNKAIITLIKDESANFNSIYCAPDFPMGGTIINGAEVKESLKNGHGEACKIQAKIIYDEKKHVLIATEMPFGVYTNTIISQINSIITDDDKCGIIKVIDATSKLGGQINIYLEKDAVPARVIARLYKETSLQHSYGINMIMLDNGRFPKVFTWRDALIAYITHIRSCKKRETEYDLNKAKVRLNIVEGLLISCANIDEVITIIRSSESTAEAKDKLIKRFGFNEEQADAILSMKLSSLTKMDGIKLESEKKNLVDEIDRLNGFLTNPALLDNELIKILEETAEKFGDSRKTRIINQSEINEVETEKDTPCFFLYNDTSFKVVEKIATKDKKMQSISTTKFSKIYYFTKDAKLYPINIVDYNINTSYKFEAPFINLIDANIIKLYQYLITVSKNGAIKKTIITDYIGCRKEIAIAKLRENDELVYVGLSNVNDNVFVLSNNNKYVYFNINEVNDTGRLTIGVNTIKLDSSDFVKYAIINNSSELEYNKKTYNINKTAKNIKGVMLK